MSSAFSPLSFPSRVREEKMDGEGEAVLEWAVEWECGAGGDMDPECGFLESTEERGEPGLEVAAEWDMRSSLSWTWLHSLRTRRKREAVSFDCVLKHVSISNQICE